MTGQIFIISAPSGAGKSSLVNALLSQDSLVRLSVSHTTRPPRAGEQEGREYHFVSMDAFREMQGRQEFLESAEVYGNLYGTALSSLQKPLDDGFDLVLEIDWQGARQVRARFADAISIFILPPSLQALRERLLARGTDTMDVIERRLELAREDLSHESEFDYAIINVEFSEAVRDLAAIVRATRCCRNRQKSRCPDMFR